MPHVDDTATVHPAFPASPAPTVPDADADAGLPGRRNVVALGAAALGTAGVAALAGCGSGSSGGSPAVAGSSAAGGSAAAGTSAAAGGSALAKLSDVPVGGAYAASGADGAPIIIAQPSAGRVAAFSARCTHQGCKVSVSGAKLSCFCHGSTFDALTGKVLTGPATKALPAVAVTVSGTDIVAG